MTTISENLTTVRTAITEAAMAAGRDPATITLIAVSKSKPAADVLAALAAGQQHFGENYVQEAVEKIAAVGEGMQDSRPIWHYIGAIQSNKTRDIATAFDWVHTVTREKIARRLNDQRPEGPRLSICLQVNVDGDPNKSGVAPEGAAPLLESCLGLDRLDVRGLMTILDPETEPLEGYNRLHELFDSLQDRAPACWDTLSMGMSGDYPAAIAAGATQVRVGTAIFGLRTART
ncbi:MAG: YggS family pyridoxal phosphate-dependent enzyme [Gammaproteobacteria bacterium]|jgi:pyridoxal phosphate enzyme (YggS family)|nr:MAG: YggS family pyridoxal phosphate-dependent enzyme [Gammaproteobacteria bacterium]